MKEDSIVFAEENTTGVPRARARFLAQAIELEEGEPRYIIPVAVFVSIFLLASLVVWGGFISVNEVAIAEGEVIPAGLIHNVQHLEGGIVDKLHVRNGDRVKEGDTLISFDPSASESELQQMLTRQAGLQLQGERLQALVEKRDPDFSKVGESYLDLAEKQRTIYLAQVSRQESELAVVDSRAINGALS